MLKRFRMSLLTAAIVVLGLADFLFAQTADPEAPQFCPATGPLTPTLLDAIFGPLSPFSITRGG